MANPDPTSTELGPVDYLVIEWTDGRPTGEAIPYLIDLVDRGIVRIIDITFVQKDDAGVVTEIAIDELGADFAVFDGAATALLGSDDVSEAAAVLAPGTAAAIVVWENVWAAPFAAAVRRNGGQVVASGRIPVDALLATLEPQV
ncbi:DUF6325 family protein [Gordonia sp. ABSL1-1]|uniref:DUF6325 family protein n=1 Tax=Gordonia sp. ABSL1-1 TaxID=3053923 RepID=UPI0025723376|nr:DUF6325 family protein [Gordonia sp. ABSL1-1]MDL9938130.1 DUF6325 family protein [Gordonia sp. ABSL1-1]